MKRKPDSIITVVFIFIVGLLASGISSLVADERSGHSAQAVEGVVVSLETRPGKPS